MRLALRNPPGLQAVLALTRLDRPVGSLLLLWPTLAALWVAAQGSPTLELVIVFSVGTFVMRSAGCVVNDLADRHFDGHVKRTRARPLVTGELAVRDAWLVFLLLAGTAGVLVLLLNTYARMLAVAGLCVAMVYPLMKRWTHLPQLVLGVAFSWGILMAFAAIRDHVPAEAWLLFVASATWIVSYDTYYAMVDRDDDLEIGVRSTAILFGDFDRLMIAALQVVSLFTLFRLGQLLAFGAVFDLGLAVIAALFVYQQTITRNRARESCFRAFRNNIWVGFVLFVTVVLELNVVPMMQAP